MAADLASVAVVIVNFNAGAMLARCVAGLKTQTRPADRVMIVDNASSDGSLDAIENALGTLRILRSPTNLGFAAANNRALKDLASFDWIALLNPDAEPEAAWLECLLAAAEQHPEFSFFASLLINLPDTHTLDGAGDAYHSSGLFWRRGHGRPRAQFTLSPQEVFGPCAAAAMYKTATLIEANGFDEQFFCYGEDVDLAFRLRLRGHRCLLVPHSVARHTGSAITGVRSDFSIYHGHRNLVWTYFKNMPSPWVWLYLPQHLLMNLVTVVRYALRGQARTILKSKWDALRGLPHVWQERKHIQQSRQVSAAQLKSVMQRGLLLPYLGRHD